MRAQGGAAVTRQDLSGYGFFGRESVVTPMVVWSEPEHPLEIAADSPGSAQGIVPEASSGGVTSPKCGIKGSGLNE
jgi:hypothetical protein